MQAGDVILFSDDDFTSRYIRAITKSHWSHVGVAISKFAFVEAVRPVVRLSPAVRAANARVVAVPYQTPQLRAAAVSAALQRVGRTYDLAGVLLFGLTVAKAVLSPTLVNLIHAWGGGQWCDWCSEVAAAALIAGEYAHTDVPPHYFSPGDIARILRVSPE